MVARFPFVEQLCTAVCCPSSAAYRFGAAMNAQAAARVCARGGPEGRAAFLIRRQLPQLTRPARRSVLHGSTRRRTCAALSTFWTRRSERSTAPERPESERTLHTEHAPGRLRDGAIDADEVEQIFKQLGHKCKRVRERSVATLQKVTHKTASDAHTRGCLRRATLRT